MSLNSQAPAYQPVRGAAPAPGALPAPPDPMGGMDDPPQVTPPMMQGVMPPSYGTPRMPGNFGFSPTKV